MQGKFLLTDDKSLDNVSVKDTDTDSDSYK